MIRLARNDEQGCREGEELWRTCPALARLRKCLPPKDTIIREDTKLATVPDNYATLPRLRIKNKDNQTCEEMALDSLKEFHLSTQKQNQESLCFRPV